METQNSVLPFSVQSIGDGETIEIATEREKAYPPRESGKFSLEDEGYWFMVLHKDNVSSSTASRTV